MHIRTITPAPRRVALSFERRQPCDVRLADDDASPRPLTFSGGHPRRGESVRPAR